MIHFWNALSMVFREDGTTAAKPFRHILREETYAVVEVDEGLGAQRGGRGAARGGREVRVAAQVARQPGQVAVAHEDVVAQLEAAQSEERLERVLAQRRHVVVVERAASIAHLNSPIPTMQTK
jgi:hypothetical protein